MSSRTAIKDLSVVVPAHNSTVVIAATVASLATRLAGRAAEIIVVENGSADDTFALCTQMVDQWRNGSLSLIVLQSDNDAREN